VSERDGTLLDRPGESYQCRSCGQSYPMAQWTIEEQWDDHPIGSWYGCAYLRCPIGHGRTADLWSVGDEKPNPRPWKAAGPERGRELRPFWAWLNRVAGRLERHSADR
jgi:hypothetical protein